MPPRRQTSRRYAGEGIGHVTRLESYVINAILKAMRWDVGSQCSVAEWCGHSAGHRWLILLRGVQSPSHRVRVGDPVQDNVAVVDATYDEDALDADKRSSNWSCRNAGHIALHRHSYRREWHRDPEQYKITRTWLTALKYRGDPNSTDCVITFCQEVLRFDIPKTAGDRGSVPIKHL